MTEAEIIRLRLSTAETADTDIFNWCTYKCPRQCTKLVEHECCEFISGLTYIYLKRHKKWSEAQISKHLQEEVKISARELFLSKRPILGKRP